MLKEISDAIEEYGNYTKTFATNKFILFTRDFINLSPKQFKTKFPTLKYKKVKKFFNSEQENPFYSRNDCNPYHDLQSRMENEGEGYFVLHYTDGLGESPTLKSFLAFQKAAVALENYVNFIEEKCKEEEETDPC